MGAREQTLDCQRLLDDPLMVRWLTIILLMALSAAALPGRLSIECDEPPTISLAIEQTAEAPPAPESCCSADQPAAVVAADEITEDMTMEHCAGGDGACSKCAIVCSALCEKASPWGVLGIGLGTDGLAHAIPCLVLLPEADWLPRESSSRIDPRAIDSDWLTLDRLRRQARLCVWTT